MTKQGLPISEEKEEQQRALGQTYRIQTKPVWNHCCGSLCSCSGRSHTTSRKGPNRRILKALSSPPRPRLPTAAWTSQFEMFVDGVFRSMGRCDSGSDHEHRCANGRAKLTCRHATSRIWWLLFRVLRVLACFSMAGISWGSANRQCIRPITPVSPMQGQPSPSGDVAQQHLLHESTARA